MKAVISLFAVVALSASSMTWAQTPANPEQKAESAKTEKKSFRKKKLQMCSECGKPEPECECAHAKESKKDDNKASSEKAEPKN